MTVVQIPYTETSAYIEENKRRNAKIDKLLLELETINLYLAEVPRKKRGQPANESAVKARKRRTNLRIQLKTAKNALGLLQTCRVTKVVPFWYWVKFLSEADGELWTPEQALAMKPKDKKAHEGDGERPYRMRLGLPLEFSTDDCDVVLKRPDGTEERIELKKIEGRSQNGTWMIQEIQTGHCGHKAYTRWMGSQAEAGLFKSLPEEQRDAIFSGEVNPSLMYRTLPENVRQSLQEVLKPSSVLKSYDKMVGTASFGTITIPKSDFDAAWSLLCVTKSGPKYKLRHQYVVDRLKASLQRLTLRERALAAASANAEDPACSAAQ